MAVQVPSVYLASVNTKRGESKSSRTNDDRPWRLPPNHVQDIRDVALGVEESNAGVCCRYLIDHLQNAGSLEIDEEDGYVHRLHEIERFVERYGDFGRIPQIVTWRMRIARARRSFARLRHRGDHRSADVLMVAYGHDDPFTSMIAGVLGRELANLARYTDAVEMRRIELVRLETARLASMPKRENKPRLDGSLSAAIEWSGICGEAHRLAVEHGIKVTDDASLTKVYDLTRRREQFEYASRSINSGDAIRHALAAFHEAPCVPIVDEGRLAFEARKEARKERQRAHDAKREAFLLETKLDAHRMLVAAEKAYHAAWLASAR